MAKPKNLLGQVIGNMFICPRAKDKDHPGKTLLAGEKFNQCNWCMYREEVKAIERIESAMTPEQIKQLTPEGYGGDFEMTMEVGE